MHLSNLWFQPFLFVMYTPVLFQPSLFPFEDTLLHALPCTHVVFSPYLPLPVLHAHCLCFQPGSNHVQLIIFHVISFTIPFLEFLACGTGEGCLHNFYCQLVRLVCSGGGRICGGLGTFPILSAFICSVASIMIKSSRRNFALTNIRINWPESSTAKGIYNFDNWTVLRHASLNT